MLKRLVVIASIALLPLGGKAFAFVPVDEALQELSQSEQWLGLLHYKSGKSLITDSDFFFSLEGRYNALEEMKGNLLKLSEDPAQYKCKFPARYAYLTSNIKGLPSVADTCPDLAEYLENLSAISASIVFASESSEFLTSSMGHVFIKIDGHRKDYLPQHAFGYFAAFTNNPIQFIPQALTFGARGAYLLEPYSYRLNKYAIDESRQIYELPLNLSDDELNTLVFHMWEMKDISPKYSLNTYNCVSSISSILSVVNPAFNESNYKWYITPHDYLERLVTESPEVVDASSLHLAKKSNASAIELGYKGANVAGVGTISISPAYNRLFDDNSASNGESVSRLFNLDLTLEDTKPFLNKFTLIERKSYAPGKVQNSLEFSLDSKDPLGRESGYSPIASFGFGVSNNWGAFTPYLYLENIGSAFSGDLSYTFSPQTGFFLHFPKGKIHAEYKYFLSTNGYKLEESLTLDSYWYIKKNLALKFGAHRYKPTNYREINGIVIGTQLSF